MSALADTFPAVSPKKTPSNPRGLGRPPSEGEIASKNVTFRLTPTQHAAYLVAADRESLTLGDWIRAACDARMPKRKRPR